MLASYDVLATPSLGRFFAMLTRQQLYELYYEGPERVIHFVEDLLAHRAFVERIAGHRQQYCIDALSAKVKQLMARLERLKAKLWKQESLNFQLTRRIQELQAELARRAALESSGVEADVWRHPDLDITLSDYSPPHSDAPRALARLQTYDLDVLFIVVSDSVSAEMAVECIKGVSNYLLLTDVVMPQMSGRELADRLATAHPRCECSTCPGTPMTRSSSAGCWRRGRLLQEGRSRRRSWPAR